MSNIWEGSVPRRLEGQRQKAGTLEIVHDGLQNELAAGVLPWGRFGAHAAWLRLAAARECWAEWIEAMQSLPVPAPS